ncbi:efflux RND transporter periplasmic adaptor subunit [Frateuria sp. STR12]|uniref:efflux RND transporter periplasmic adaptor subunit n=1 Tax=Frateuria hangzhouensis TaxID=2995589 RepID=UPI002260AD2A|nr:efflux RND transporter periplasmic adaptor subunit [Frateuria sp. STR12]MCX7515057.1 efflux RND transporter periplasmic adaptor subunit [Frateuria sp. STR12]
MDNGDLLRQLKIGHGQREAVHAAPLRWPWIVGAVVLVLLALGIGGWWMFAQRPVAVQTATAASPGKGAGAGAVLQATGYVTARRQATVSAQIVGTLSEVLIEEGDHVRKGQVLAKLEDNAYRASLEAAQAAAAAAQAQVAQARVQLDQSRKDAQRMRTLAARGLVAKQAAEQAGTSAAVAAAQLETSRKQAASARAQAAEAKVSFDYTVVRAPFDGVVTDKTAQVGEIISPMAAGGGFTRTGVGTIVDMDSLEVDVDVNEAYIGRVKPHMPAQAVLDAYPDWTIPAHVIAIVPAADRGKATVKVRVALERKDARIVPDMGVRVSFLEARPKATAQAPPGVLVPAAAIATRDGNEVVFVVQGDRVQQRRVQPRPMGGQRLIPEGVQAGDTVVVSPPAALRDGAAVNVDNKQS